MLKRFDNPPPLINDCLAGFHSAPRFDSSGPIIAARQPQGNVGKIRRLRNAEATRLYVVPVTWRGNPVFGSPTIINGRWSKDAAWGRDYDVHPDGKRLVMIASSSTAGSEITVVLNWFEELKRKMHGK